MGLDAEDLHGLAHHEIRVNAIAPGHIPTPLPKTSGMNVDADRFERPQSGGTPEDIAEAALYFASDRSRYVTGTVLPVDGGTVAGKAIRSKKRE